MGKGTKDVTTKCKSSYPSKPSDFLPPKVITTKPPKLINILPPPSKPEVTTNKQSSALSDSDLDDIVVPNKGVGKV